MTKESHLSPPLKIEDLDQLRSIGDKVFISGVIYTARDTVIIAGIICPGTPNWQHSNGF